MRARASAALLLAACVALCACARDQSEDADTAEEPSIAAVMLEALVEGPGHRRQARKLPRERLLGDLVAAASPASQPTPVPSVEDLDALARRLGITLAEDLVQVLRTPGAIDALHWQPPARIERASALGTELASLLRAQGAPGAQRVTVEDFAGGSFELPLEDLRGYVVLARQELFGDVLLYDPAEPPRHPCCRLVESPVLRNDTATGYRDLGEWLAMEWSLLQMRKGEPRR